MNNKIAKKNKLIIITKMKINNGFLRKKKFVMFGLWHIRRFQRKKNSNWISY